MHRPSLLKYLLCLSIIFTLILLPGCNAEKRLQKAIMELDQNKLNKQRAWPYNYTFQEYTYQLDNAKLRQEFYRKRGIQARIAGDKRTQAVMEKNVDQYQKTIDRLEDDKEFYKVYKMREHEIKLKLKEEQKVQAAIEKRKQKLDKEALKRDKTQDKHKKKLQRERQSILDNKMKRLENQKKEYISTHKETEKTLKDRRKELSTLEKIATESGSPNDTGFEEERERLNNEIERLNNTSIDLLNDIDSINIVIEKFIFENYNKKDTVVENQMKLTPQTVPQKTTPIEKSDSIK